MCFASAGCVWLSQARPGSVAPSPSDPVSVAALAGTDVSQGY